MNFSRRNINRMIKKAKITGAAWGFAFGLSFGLIPWMCELAYQERGYVAVGGEWLLPLFPLCAYMMYGTVKEDIKSMKERMNDDESL